MKHRSEKQYHEMVRDLVVQLEKLWGKEKFQEWYKDNILPLNGKIYLDYRSYYIMLKAEMDVYHILYSQFREQYAEQDAMARDWTEQHFSERP